MRYQMMIYVNSHIAIILLNQIINTIYEEIQI